jgi:hypothetical protein
MKIFLSHQKSDSLKAAQIAVRLKTVHQIDSYLDVIDPFLNSSGEDLSAHIRTEMSKCTQLLAVVSYETRNSQWVPWEIGVATEKNFPLATFADYTSSVPEFLEAWPYLRSMDDVDAYALASQAALRTYSWKRAITLNEDVSKRASAESFYNDLRTRLRQSTKRRN